jgi:serine/threonine protein kinase/formylglycine-generating enzyme required for sulfatase activity
VHAFDPAASRPEDTEETAPHLPEPDPEPILPPAIGRYPVRKILGKGAFGTVYLARDNDLRRDVAIKVPNPGRVACPEDVEAYLREARILAELDHPNIVTVYEVGRTEDDPCFIVSKYIEGSNLADRIKQGRPSFWKSAELVAAVAEALHYAHTRGLVHRDIKPANILIDTASKPYVADFGLALRDEDYGEGASFVGTPVYMSPEQARREGHRVDGQSDVFSLGVVFYELLTGKRPFRGMKLIADHDAEPCRPREIDGTIPRELERIALNALAKNKKDRCTTLDLAEDLRHFLRNAAPPEPKVTLGPGPVDLTQQATQTPPSTPPPDSDSLPAKIIPRGLRSFDEQDADFFLELLPGPRDRDGLPESVRFWKRKIELLDPDKTFRVGLIYGPSGCGKSSLVKAGVLPRLAKHVRHVYVESTPEETETRLARSLHKTCPELPGGRGLVESLAEIRRGRVLCPGKKVLVVLDQFEQWLFARRGEPNPELITALRQCDGEHVQAVVMVRIDFWMAAIRFMRDLEVRLVEGENSAAVDLFDPLHARRVLTAFGRAYGVLPERTSELTPEQRAFLEHSVAGIAQDGKVISVRLALFAEMVKGKPWTPATLRDVGGTQGVGVTFLDETFSASTAPPEHRLHQKAAQAALKALLPHSGTDIKGQMRSESELRNASGYADRPRDFDDLIRILDSLRLITPTDPEGSAAERQTVRPDGERYYQLTHDYLIHSLRDWLTRKQRETRRGRAELRLAERTALWNAKPENRHLPSVLEWANIRLLTKKREWTEPQRQVMRRAGRFHGLRALGLVVLIALGTWSGVEAYGHLHSADLVESLETASTADVPRIIERIARYRHWADPRLRRMLSDSDEQSREHFRAGLALLAVDPAQVDLLRKRLLAADPDEVLVLREALKPHRSQLTPKLWLELDSAQPGEKRLLCAAGALALYDPENPEWATHGAKVAQTLVKVNPVFLGDWLSNLEKVIGKLTPSLAAIFREKQRLEAERALATNILAKVAEKNPGLVAELLMDADPQAFATLFPVVERQVVVERQAATLRVFQKILAGRMTEKGNDTEQAKDEVAERQARAAVALIRLGHGSEVWPLLRHSPDPRLRSFLVNWLRPLGADPKLVAAELDCLERAGRGSPDSAGRGSPDAALPGTEDLPSALPQQQLMDAILFHPETSKRRTLILALGTYGSEELSPGEREPLIAKLLELYRNDPDAGVHSAAEWTLRRWQQGDELEKIDREAMASSLGEESRWFRSCSGHVMSIIRGPMEFRMGSPLEESDRDNDEFPHREKLLHSFAIATKEITVKQFEQFLKENPRIADQDASGLSSNKNLSAAPNAARNAVTWYEAVAYCNWLSKNEGLPESQWCYKPNKDGQYAEGMRIEPNFLMKIGYRLPIEAEWEYVCRAGSDTTRFYGRTEELLDEYAWYLKNDEGYRPGGAKKPNDLGLFDVIGNVWEWCQDEYNPHPSEVSREEHNIIEVSLIVSDRKMRVLRGAAIDDVAKNVRSANRGWNGPNFRYGDYGFRVARTLP